MTNHWAVRLFGSVAVSVAICVVVLVLYCLADIITRW